MMTEWTWKKILMKSRLFFFNLNPLTKLRCGTYPSFQLPERETEKSANSTPVCTAGSVQDRGQGHGQSEEVIKIHQVLVAHTCNPSYSGGSRFEANMDK
jgi:hypothetical protein